MGDPEGKALEAFHVTHAMDAAELEKMKGYGIDVEAHAGNAKHIYATPSAFLIDASGKVRWGHVDPDASHRPTPKQLLSVLDKVKL
jgi:peroxiredoxin